MALKMPTPQPPPCSNIQKDPLRKRRLTFFRKGGDEVEEDSDEAEGGEGGKEDQTVEVQKMANAAEGMKA